MIDPAKESGKQVVRSIGATGKLVVANVETLRRARGYSLRDLSDRLAENGRPIWPSALLVMAQHKRRIDVDDLAALAAALGTTPARLLGPMSCGVCLDAPPTGFTCNACGTTGATP